MPSFSDISDIRLRTCHPKLQVIMRRAIKKYDFTVLCGHRGEEEQTRAYEAGNSKLRYPMSKHNSEPSMAVDIAPYPIDWNDIGRFQELAAVVLEEAALSKIPLKWGGNWKNFKDYPHFELAEANDAG